MMVEIGVVGILSFVFFLLKQCQAKRYE